MGVGKKKATTSLQLVNGAILTTKAVDPLDALHERNKVEEAMERHGCIPTLTFPDREGPRTVASQHIIQVWNTPVTVVPVNGREEEL